MNEFQWVKGSGSLPFPSAIPLAIPFPPLNLSKLLNWDWAGELNIPCPPVQQSTHNPCPEALTGPRSPTSAENLT